jgi:hypothetical protein
MSVSNRFNTASGMARVRMPFWLAAGLALIAAPASTFAQTFNCNLLVPANPLTAAGLTTPYVLSPTNPPPGGTDSCDETSAVSAAFVQAVIYDNTLALCGNSMCIYNPLVINAGTTAAAPPVALPGPIPATATVGLWFGFDGGDLTLTEATPGATLAPNHCVPSPGQLNLGQFAYCNAVAFFSAVNTDIAAHALTVPALGTGNDHQPCPTARHFGVVDQDQSDNQTTFYWIVTPTAGSTPGTTAQFNAANMASFPGGMSQQNPSDEWLVAQHMDAALGCTPWMVPDMSNGNTLWPSMPTNEIQAAMYQKAPIALIPLGDPFTQNPPQSGIANLGNVNAYRAGVDQPMAVNNTAANTTTYCTNLRSVGAQKLVNDANYFKAAPSPLPVGDTLYTTLAARMQGSYVMLNCQALTGQPNPVTINSVNGQGLVNSVTIKPGSSSAQ